MTYNLDAAIRKVPDFPKKGILFYDVTGIITTPPAFAAVVDEMVRLYAGKGFTAIAAVESRGFVFAAPLALRLGLPLILIRKKGKLPGKTLGRAYALEYGEAEIEVQVADVPQGGNVLVIDDLLATGGTLAASVELLREGGAVVTDVFCVVGLPFLNPAAKLPGLKITTLIDYHGE